MEPNSFTLRPDAGTFRAVDILDHLILDVREDMFAARVSLFADLRAYLHQIGIFLLSLSGHAWLPFLKDVDLPFHVYHSTEQAHRQSRRNSYQGKGS